VSVVTPESGEPWTPGRGDYGTEYAGDLIEIIEAHNCVKGCTRTGTPREIEDYGPGGTCEILARVSIPDAVPELDPRPEGPHCTARVDPATVGMEPLFGEPS
jgi:hypothetical protein